MAISSKLLNEGEHVVVTTRTHPKALLLPLLVLVLRSPWRRSSNRLGEASAADIWHLVVWILAALAIVWWVAPAVPRLGDTSYTFTDRRLITRSGLIAKQGPRIPLNRISDVAFEIGLIDRMFGCGTLVIVRRQRARPGRLHDIPRVEEVQRKVAEELHRLAARARVERADDGT